MKRFILCLVAFVFVATFASAQSQRLGSLAEVEKDNAIPLGTAIVSMIDNMRKDSDLYEQYKVTFEDSLMVFTDKQGNVVVFLGFPRKGMGDPSMREEYDNAFAYCLSQGFDQMKDSTTSLVVSTQQPDGSLVNYVFPKAALDGLAGGTIQIPDFEEQVEVECGPTLDDLA
jgi:hypothetical protein